MADHDAQRRILARISVTESGCWEWGGARDRTGYGAIKLNGRKVSTHRVAYEAFVGPIPDGLWIDHLCRNRPCVNPDHLEPVTPAQNTNRGLAPVINALRAWKRDSCAAGHPLTPENVVPSAGYRKCRTCQRARNREYMQRARAGASS